MRRPYTSRAGMAGGAMGVDMMTDLLAEQMLEMQAAGMMAGAEQPAAAGTPGAAGTAGEAAKGTLKINPAKDITIASDATTNSIMVMAPQEGMKLVKKLIEKLEDQDIPTKIESFELKFADATKVATELEKLFQSRSSGGSDLASRLGLSRPSTTLGSITVASDARTNTIVVRALEPDMAKVRPIVEGLDKLPPGTPVQIYAVEHGDAKAMAQVLQQIFGQDAASGTGTRAIKISADTDTNSIVVSAPDAQQKIIAARIKELDDRAQGLKAVKQIQLQIASPTVVATKLLDVFVGKKAGRGGKNEITIVGDDSSKLLFVTAPQEVYARIEDMAKMMDKSATQDIRVFSLKYASATDMLARFKEMMARY